MIIYDCEIKKCIPDANSVHSGSIQYCLGWSDYKGMGISVLCAFDTDTGTHHTFTPDDASAERLDAQMAAFAALVARTDYVVGFNNASFDNNLVAAHGVAIPPEKSYDIYVQVIDAAGLSNAPFRYRKGYKLDDLCRANGIQGKDGHGIMAPVLYQTGKLQELHAYCKHDVEMTVQVLDCILRGDLRCPKSNNVLKVRTPHEKLGSVQPGMF